LTFTSVALPEPTCFYPPSPFQVRERVGPEGHVIGAVSGGVDSTVAAVLMHKALGARFHAILVDNGCLRHGEAKEVSAWEEEKLEGRGYEVAIRTNRKRDRGCTVSLYVVVASDQKKKLLLNLIHTSPLMQSPPRHHPR